ncbi:Mannan endo-1,4-beta-mannosidase [Pseudopedobacter saltans DSM 12145]|uniref:Mannan endo-1,4-beta-mannosidase n=1 Tax=Pseudopedobacter saltans (strain ATCC 51119 / DSM 12145 / JCM 21818 / CCUG 39354 / LMG 10337 / NBRC 100064 / NCIMB 13643) TaxID=762903 RepID=F0S9G1_PSESL|nr:glycosyl hydrolase [Pseudopedobacter saltans]ADY53514.1 Mannan endo-1,4-beta-mannosidase [Pseudopedobacter saltans DSM 12145]
MAIRIYKIFTLFLVSYFLQHTALAQLIDPNATKETLAVYKSVKGLLGKKILFGHQDDLAYGVRWKYEKNRSDINDIVNDYPAVFGWDIGGVEFEKPENLDKVPFEKIISFAKEVYKKGGINTISWHLANPVSGGSAWDTTKAVVDILPKGKLHNDYILWLDRVAGFLNRFETADGTKIPVLFRPFHELNGAWFWWGRPHCSKDEFITLWRFTVDYLKNKKHLHHLIYVFNTNSFNGEDEFLERYPGNSYADMVSFDIYQFAPENPTASQLKESKHIYQEKLRNNLQILTSVAKKLDKPSALAETGFESVPDPDWWTKTLYPVIKDFPISYVLVWRNHGLNDEGKMHYYAPYKGQLSAIDFKKFYTLKKMMFLKDLGKQKIYQ